MSSVGIYLDHAATSWPKPPEVAEAILQTLQTLTANAGRSGHRASLDSARMVSETRQQLGPPAGRPQLGEPGLCARLYRGFESGVQGLAQARRSRRGFAAGA